MKNKLFITNICLLLTMFTYPEDAHAYINPSVFSFIGILLAGAITVIGFYFYKIIGLFENLFLIIKNILKK
tara:strand:+ start:179 stop:391 length:213 start_codon:yes stop_codon:yes gene_type:complete